MKHFYYNVKGKSCSSNLKLMKLSIFIAESILFPFNRVRYNSELYLLHHLESLSVLNVTR